MNMLGAVLLVLITASSGFSLNTNGPFPINQSHITQRVGSDTLGVSPPPRFPQQNLSKKPFRSLWNMFKREPWRLSRYSG